MAEEYSEVWVEVRSSKDAKAAIEELSQKWEDILNEYAEYDIVDDTSSMHGVPEIEGPVIEDNIVLFGLGAHASGGSPNYSKQYQAMGEMIYAIQETLVDWDVKVDLTKTGASG